MRVLVTGHHGYIGSVLVRYLRQKGYEVHGVDTFFFRNCDLEPGETVSLEIFKDIRDITPEDLKGYEAVLHLAALSNDPMGDLNPELTFDINARASIRLAQSAKAAGVRRFLFASSCSMYGAAGDAVLDEDAPLHPLTAYAVSKVQTEQGLSELADDDFSPVYLRNATAYGISPRFRADVVLNNLVCWAVTTGQIRILSDGTPWRPIVHVEDIARAFEAMLHAPQDVIHNQAFNVGLKDENYQVRDLADIVRDTVPDCRIEYADQAGPDPRNYRVDFSKLARMIPEFQPAWNARRGAEEIYRAIQKVNLTQSEFEGKKYVRLKQLRHLMDTGQLNDDLRWISGQVGM